MSPVAAWRAFLKLWGRVLFIIVASNAFKLHPTRQRRCDLRLSLLDDVRVGMTKANSPFLYVVGSQPGLSVGQNVTLAWDSFSCKGVSEYELVGEGWRSMGTVLKDCKFTVERVSGLSLSTVAVRWKVSFIPGQCRQLVALARFLPVEIRLSETLSSARTMQQIVRALSSGVLSVPLAVVRGHTEMVFSEHDGGYELISQRQKVSWEESTVLSNPSRARHHLEFIAAVLPQQASTEDFRFAELEAASVDYSIDLGPISILIAAICIFDAWLISNGVYNSAMLYDFLCYSVGC